MQAITTSQAQPDSVALGGLSTQEVEARRARGMGNTAPPPTGRTYAEIFRENIVTFINGAIFALGLALALLGRPGDAVMSISIITLNILVSVVQEIRAKRTLDRIALLTRPTATVIRDGRPVELPPEELVIGDLALADAGDQILLDGHLVSGRMLVDESLLTGEADLVAKREGDPVYSGSFCTNGRASYAVDKVGADSLANQITAGARAFRRVLTPLQREVYLVIRIMLLVVIYLSSLLIFNGLIKQLALVDSVQNVTILAGLVPNGLFLSISIAYALGAVRIARSGALVQQSNAIESLSNVDTLCLDKTGTLTTGDVQFQGLYPLAATGDTVADTLGMAMASAASGNKTSQAIADALPRPSAHLVAEIPFSSVRKWSAVALADGERQGIYALGAPEVMRAHLGLDTPDGVTWGEIAARNRRLADEGLRVLLFAHSPDPSVLHDDDDASRLPVGMTPLALVALSDELRPDAREILARFGNAGVELKIISGDNPDTVVALARRAGFSRDARAVSGLELAEMSEARFIETVLESQVFGRITPQQKERIVQALKDHGRYVAMIGDGVNDVLSLKRAHLAIAMQSGSQATRAVADIVLLGDNFSVLPHAVAEGQRILNGMQDILKLYLNRILTVGLVIVSALVIGEFPILLRQGTLVTMLSVGIPAILLAYWARPGATAKGSLLNRLFGFVLPSVLTSSVIALLLFYGTFLLLVVVPGLGGQPPDAADLETIIRVARAGAQTVLVSFLVVVGLLAVVFVQPPSKWWAVVSPVSPDRRPALLAGILFLAFVVVNSSLIPRRFFTLARLAPLEVVLVAIGALVWLLVVRTVWRHRLLERFLGVPLTSVDGDA